MYVLETGPQQTASTYPVVSGANVLLVVKCEFFSGNDRFTLYVNPTPGEPPPARRRPNSTMMSEPRLPT